MTAAERRAQIINVSKQLFSQKGFNGTTTKEIAQASGISEAMEAVWLHEPWVRCVHPGWEMLTGWQSIRKSWSNIFKNAAYLKIHVSKVTVHVHRITPCSVTSPLSNSGEAAGKSFPFDLRRS